MNRRNIIALAILLALLLIAAWVFLSPPAPEHIPDTTITPNPPVEEQKPVPETLAAVIPERPAPRAEKPKPARQPIAPEDETTQPQLGTVWDYTDEELQILANTVWHEAKYCTDRHQQLVAQVVLNRVRDERFPDSIAAVVKAPGQYNPAYLVNLPDPATEDAELRRCFLNARAALEGRVECPADVLYQSEFSCLGSGHYETITVNTGWYCSVTYFNYG